MDAVAGLLDGPRARGGVPAALELDPPWSLRIRGRGAADRLSRSCAARRGSLPDGGDPVALRAGDVAVFRGPDPYTVADDPATRAAGRRSTPARVPRDAGRPGGRLEMRSLGVRTWGNAADGATVMLTGTYQLDGEVSRRLLRALPPLLVLRRRVGLPARALLADEIVKDEPGQEAVLDRLLDLLLIAVLRAWFARPDADAPGWYRAYGDPVVGQRAAAAAPQPRPPVDGRRAGARGRRLARRAGPPLQRARRRAADDVPHRLADRARRRPAAASRARRSARSPTRSATAARSRSARPSSGCAGISPRQHAGRAGRLIRYHAPVSRPSRLRR